MLLPATLEAALSCLKTTPNHQGKIVVVDNNSTDRTSDVAKDYGVDVVFEAINQISKARNAGGRHCPEVDYLIFLDADSLLTPELLQFSLEKLDSGKHCGGGALFELECQSGKNAAAIWALVSKLTGLAGGAFIFCLNEGFKDVQGFSEKVYAAEDVLFSRALKKWGRKRKQTFIISTKIKIFTSDRKLKWHSNWMILKTFLLISIFPWRVRNRDKMKLWYERPQEKNSELKKKY